MDPELKAYLDNITSQLGGLKGEMGGLKGELGGLKGEMGAMETRLREHTETIETRLLTEFWKWAQTAELRYSQDHSAVSGIDGRVKAIEDRVSELERRRRAG